MRPPETSLKYVFKLEVCDVLWFHAWFLVVKLTNKPRHNWNSCGMRSTATIWARKHVKFSRCHRTENTYKVESPLCVFTLYLHLPCSKYLSTTQQLSELQTYPIYLLDSSDVCWLIITPSNYNQSSWSGMFKDIPMLEDACYYSSICPPVIKLWHGQSRILLGIGDFPASHVWSPEGKSRIVPIMYHYHSIILLGHLYIIGTIIYHVYIPTIGFPIYIHPVSIIIPKKIFL